MTLLNLPWAPSIGLDFVLIANSISGAFSCLILFIAALIAFYCFSYLRHFKSWIGFAFHFFVFTASMLGVVLSDNLLLTFVFWELTSISSYFLISINFENESARKNALQALLVTFFGGLFLLAGILGLSLIFESYSLTSILLDPEKLVLSPHANWILICFLIACFSKSAQVPFHFWLPSAMVAPTPVSAMLHSATMVKAGVFLLFVLRPLFSYHPWWAPTLTLVGAVTFVWGTFWAFAQMDLKKAFAGTTVSTLGLLVLILGLPGDFAQTVFVALFLAHSLYKASLFLLVGSIEKGTGTRMLTELSGLKRKMPFTSWALALALFSMAGFPPALSFFVKEALLGALADSPWASILTAAVLVSFSVNAAYCVYIAYKILYGHKSAKVDSGKENNLLIWGPPWILALLALTSPLLFVFYPHLIVKEGLELHFWNGLSPELILSLLSFAFAGVFYLIFESHIVPLIQKTFLKLPLEQPYNGFLKFLYLVADQIKMMWQRKGLRFSLSVTLWFSALVLLWQMKKIVWPAFEYVRFPVSFLDFVFVLSLIGGALGVLLLRTPFTKVLALSWVGLGIAFIYFLGGAPDLALTQFLVEILATLFFILVLIKMPKTTVAKLPNSLQSQNLLISFVFSGTMCAAVWLAFMAKPSRDLVTFFGEKSWIEAHGRNVVNVILVDFRGFDTLGEITVLAIGALSLSALFIKSKRSPR